MRSLFGLVVIVACTSLPDGAPSALSTTDEGATVVADSEWKTCAQATECALVDASCDGCCQQDAVRADLASAYAEDRMRVCEGYDGGVCDCQPAEVRVVCSAGQCGLDVVGGDTDG